ncbi:MAG TPA: GNAT family N-acetyltransferase [Gemmatimonadales bacterium]|jgi:GNAT superfamily N-acetyltransferase
MSPSSRASRKLRVIPFEPRHRDAFRDLNLAWISRYFGIEDADLKVLEDPEAAILAPGGAILMAEMAGEAVGTVALIRVAPDGFELAKMAVTPVAQGHGIGALLGRAAIERARQLGARWIELLSNTSLAPALHLYRKLGFVEVPLGASAYRRADIRMVLKL